MRRALPAAAVLAGTLVLAGCGAGDPELSVGDAFVPAPPTADMAAGFLTVTNDGGSADTLTEVTSDAADSVEIHETVGQTMRQVDSLDVPAGGTLDLDRGGNHLMLIGLDGKPAEGQKITVELHFSKSGTITAELPVKAATYNPTSR
ncbi:copper chaperone PCu(A)C [Streptomyces sp. NPDC060194]|uniref:copper chaperone PCu(A)C n=1 Tax=Streptomyces sp. NPDC060194 TaxID=3347069 RepID=UPI0036576933